MPANPDNDAIAALHEGGKSTRQIAKILGDIDHSTVARRLKHLTPRKTTEIYKEQRANVLAELQRKILNTCNYDAIKQMAPRDRVTAMAILYDKERLERGESTANIASIHADIAALRGQAKDASTSK
jgi:hypothetical protein